jgi:hypothetical protein
MLLTKAAPSQSVLFYASVRYLLSGNIDTILQQMIYYRIINNITTLLVKQELRTLPEHLSAPPDFSGVRVNLIVSFMCMFCRLLVVLLYFYFWPLCCLFFFDIQILITPLVSSNPSYKEQSTEHFQDSVLISYIFCVLGLFMIMKFWIMKF